MIFISCAFDFEARPLIEKLQLKSITPIGRFRLYESADANIKLCITGEGSYSAAAGTAAMIESYGKSDDNKNSHDGDIAVNFGICGASENAELKVSETVAACSIKKDGERPFYPDMIYEPEYGLKECELFTSSEPVTFLNSDKTQNCGIFDMEAYGFALAAADLGIKTSHIFVIKTVSDIVPESAGREDEILNAEGREKIKQYAYDAGIKVCDFILDTAKKVENKNRGAFDFTKEETLAVERLCGELRLSDAQKMMAERFFWREKLLGRAPIDIISGFEKSHEEEILNVKCRKDGSALFEILRKGSEI